MQIDLGKTATVPGQVVTSSSYTGYRREWLALNQEEVIEPDLPIVDAHHHVWDTPRPRYMFDEVLEDFSAGGHNIRSSVFVDCRSMYRKDGPVEMRCLGEVEFVNGIAAMAASGAYGPARICDGIVGFGALNLGRKAQPVLEALMRAGGERLKGVRQVSAWDADHVVCEPNPARPPGLLSDKTFREGFALLEPLGLRFDAWLFHTQIAELTDLALAFPGTPIVLDHTGSPLGLGPYAGRRDEIFAAWKTALADLARCANVCIKIGGLGMTVVGSKFYERSAPPSSAELADAWRPYVETCIELFGAKRCMFESNFPPDKGSFGYRELWNAFKRITAGASAEEKADLFALSAGRFYNLRVD